MTHTTPVLRLTILATLLLCVGCAVGPDFQRPDAPTGQRLTREPVSATAGVAVSTGTRQTFEVGAQVQRDWWTLYASPTLNELVELALNKNPTIEAAQASLKQAQAMATSQRGFYFPNVQVGYAPLRQGDSNTLSPTLNSGDTPFTLNTAQVSVGFTPDVFGLNRRTVESLDAQAENQKFQLDAASVTLATNVVSAAIAQAALRAQINATEDIIRASSRSLDLLRAQAKIGFASGLDVAAQETALAQAEQTLPPLHKQLEQTRNLIAVLAGKLPSEGGLENFDLDALQLPATLPVSLPSQIVDQRPDVRAAEATLHAASAAVGVSIAQRLPQFSLTAFFGGAAVPFNDMFNSSNQFWGVTGNLAQTVFDLGTLKYRQVAAESGMAQAGAQYRSTVLTAFQNVADTLTALDADAKSLAAAVKAENAARKTYELTQQQLKIGAVNALAMLLADQAYQQTSITRIQAQASRLTDTAALFQSLGGGWSVPTVPTVQTVPTAQTTQAVQTVPTTQALQTVQTIQTAPTVQTN